MKLRKLTKVAAVTMAMVMCVSSTALASSTGRQEITSGGQSGSFETDFDIYSPTIKVNVPLNLNIRVNPMNKDGATDVSQFTVASKSMDIANESMDGTEGIPVNVTINATITGKAEEVQTYYNDLTPDANSQVKKIHLMLAEAATPATLDKTNGYQVSAVSGSAAVYNNTVTNKVSITQYGSLLSMDIAAPATSSDMEVGSFAVVGEANTGARWTGEDIAVEVTYDIRASKEKNFTTPTLGDTSIPASADVEINLTGIGEAEVSGIAIHNDADYKDADLATAQVEYPTNGTAKITVSKDDEALAYIKENYTGEAQDVCIVLSDGRVIVSTMTP